MLLKIKKLNKHYKVGDDQVQVLKNVDLEFNKGELVAILGESGSGKSTLMNIIGGLDSDYQGEVNVEGENLRELKEKKLDKYRKNKVGFVFQSFNLISHLSVLENVAIALTISNVSKRKRIKKAKEILAEVGLKDHYYKKPNQLSGGQKQRVAIARALINDPEIILADEPTGALDSKTSGQILKILEKIAASGKLVIMVTHSPRVSDISKRVVTIADGKIESDEVKEEIKQDFEEVEATIEKQNLSLMAAIKLGLNNMREKLFRNILVALGSSIGIFSVVLMLSLGQGVRTFINDEITGFMDPTHIQVVLDEPNPDAVQTELPPPPTQFNEDQVKELSEIRNVEYVSEAVSFTMSSMVMHDNESFDIIAFEAMTNLERSESEAYLIGSQPGTGEIVVSTVLAERMMGEDNYRDAIGESVTIFINETEDGKPIIISRDLVVSGLYNLEEYFESELLAAMANVNMAMMDFNYLQTVYADAGIELNAHSVLVVANDLGNVSGIRDAITDKGFYIFDLQDMMDQILEYLDIATLILSGIAAISLLVSGIMILIVLYISVVERTREIGVLRAIGARKKDIRRIFFVESALLGLFGGILGVISATLVGMLVNLVMENQFNATIVSTNIEFMLFGIGVSILVSVIAGISPAAKAAKLDPVESLRHE